MTARPHFRIASYNIRKARGTDGRRDPERIVAVIATLRADIVVLQEADLRLGPRVSALPRALILRQAGLAPVALARSPVSLGWHGNAILAPPGTAVDRILHVDLPGLEPRGAVIADLRLAAGPVRVVGVHMGLLRSSRRKQISRTKETLATLPPLPTVIAGDFNERSAEVGLGRLMPDFDIHTPGPTFHARRPFTSLDRFAINDGLRLDDMGVLHDPVTARASDHLPIWASLMLTRMKE